MAEDATNLSFARLIPINEQAQTAFAGAVSVMQQKRDRYHLRFYKDADRELTANLQSSEGETSYGSTTSPDSILNPQRAYANLTLSHSARPRYPRIGWRVGHTTHNADVRIFITERDDPSADNPNLSGFEFRLFIHPRSGLLCLQRASTDLPLSYADRAQNRIPLDPREIVVLLSPITKLTLGSYEFQLEYTVSEKHATSFFDALNVFLTENHGTSLHEAGHKTYPSISLSNLAGKYLVGGILGTGAFGDVHYGVDVKSGEPVALKNVRIRDAAWRQEVTNEIVLMEELKGTPCCMQLLATWCQYHDVHPKDCPGSKDKEHFYLVTDIALFDFSDPAFVHLHFPKILELSRQILAGVRELHKKGVMHRDISLKNCLVVSTAPTKAILGDFGKAIRAVRHSLTSTGPIANCAPEIWSKDYTNTVDLWSWAYMMAQHLGYVPAAGDRNRAITPERLAQIISFLQEISDKKSEVQYTQLVDLLTKILIWEPAERLTVAQALRHDVWTDLSAVKWDDQPENSDEWQAKRRKVDNAGDRAFESVETVPMSQNS